MMVVVGEEQRLDRADLVPELDERFDAPVLDPARWVAHYLPEWTTPERSAARFDLEPGLLRLRIDADQPAWMPEEGELRVSNIQTGTFSGPAGTHVGQSRHRPDLVVRTPQPLRRLYTPVHGVAEVELRATADPTCMAAFWLIGVEDTGPEASGELCVCELFGERLEPGRARVNVGVKAQHDPRLRTDMAEVELAIDATGWHTYGVEWDGRRSRFYVDDVLVREVAQGVDYPLQLLVDLFEFPAGPERDPAAYPKTAEVRAVRGFSRSAARS
jgi:hypothetical protein